MFKSVAIVALYTHYTSTIPVTQLAEIKTLNLKVLTFNSSMGFDVLEQHFKDGTGRKESIE